ncbi:MAG: PTS sugar transporter subunit IIA, partial [Spirochaetes bacterium]|nr:PTS sugar transporter subunit IIA [Spirochaetota bacterium]
MVRLFDYLKLENVIVVEGFNNKSEIFTFIAEKFSKITGFDKEFLYEEFIKREESLSTGIGHSIAIPHIFIEGLDDIYVLIIKSNRLLNYGSVDKQPVFLIISFVGGLKTSNKYLTLLSQIITNIQNRGLLEKLLEIKDP